MKYLGKFNDNYFWLCTGNMTIYREMTKIEPLELSITCISIKELKYYEYGQGYLGYYKAFGELGYYKALEVCKKYINLI